MNSTEHDPSNDLDPEIDRPGRLKMVDVGFGQTDGASDDRLDLKRIVKIFARRRRMFALVFALSLGLAAVVTAFMPTLYTATAEVVINTPDPSIPTEIEMAGQPLRNDADVDTELRVVYSTALASKIVDDLKLVDDPDFNNQASPMDRLSGWIKSFFDLSSPASSSLSQQTPEDTRASDIDALRNGLTATRVGNAYALHIAFDHADPSLAAQLANAYAYAYVDDQRARSREENDRVIGFLKERIDQLQEQARRDYNAVQQYRIDNNVMGSSEAPIVENGASGLKESTAQPKGLTGNFVDEGRASSSLSALRSQRAIVTAEVGELRTRYGRQHPDVKAAQGKLDDIDRQILAELDNIVTEHADINRALVAFDDLQRRAETSQTVYESYLNAYKGAVARSGIEEAHARVISEARIPSAPSQPQTALNLIFGGLLGLGLGAIFAFIAEMNFSGLTTGREIESNLAVPFLGFVPSNESTWPRGRTVLQTIARHRRSPMVEALSNLLTSIKFALGRTAQVIYVTSAVPDEGKTTLACALGATAAMAGRSTVVVDCDGIRRGLMDVVPHKKWSAGLESVLIGVADIDSALTVDRATGCHFLAMTSEFPPDNFLNRHHAITALIAQLRTRFDTVILDAAPLLATAASRELALNADFVVMAVRWRKTSNETVREALKLLPSSLRRSVGIALTRVDLAQQSMYSPHEYYHSKRYAQRQLPSSHA